MRARDHRRNTGQEFVTTDHFIAHELYLKGTMLAPVAYDGIPAAATTPPQRWAAYATQHTWRFADRRAPARARRARQQERALLSIMRGQAATEGWLQAPIPLGGLLETLLEDETGAVGRTTCTDVSWDAGATERDKRTSTRRWPGVILSPVTLADAAAANRADGDAKAVLRLMGVRQNCSDEQADAPWSAFPPRPHIDPQQRGSLGEWTYRAAHNQLTIEDVDDTEETWALLLMGHAAPQLSQRRRESAAPTEPPTSRADAPAEPAPTAAMPTAAMRAGDQVGGDLVTVSEAARLLQLTPSAVRQRIHRHHLRQEPCGRTHLVHLDEVRKAS